MAADSQTTPGPDLRMCVTCGKMGGTCRWVDDPIRCMQQQLKELRHARELTTTKPPGFDKAYEAALEDARQLGAGFFMITPSGCRHVPAEAVSIDAAKYLEMTRDAES